MGNRLPLTGLRQPLQAAGLCGLALQAVLCWAGPADAVPTATAPALPAVLNQPALVTPKALRAGMLALARAGTRLVAVGERGTVLLSDDGGQQWRQASVPVQTTLTGVRFADAEHGWAVGHLGVVLHTDDGGQRWVKQLDGVQAAALALQAASASGDGAARRSAEQLVQDGPDKPFFDVECLDAQRAIVVGAFGLAYITGDGGKTWQPAQQRMDARRSVHLYAVRRVGEQLYIAGEQGLLMRSADQGASFQTVPTPYKGSFFGLLASPSGAVLAYGLRGNAYRSADQGVSWEKVETGVTVGLSAGLARSDASLALVSQNGDVLASRDDGRHFTRHGTWPMPAAGLAEAGDGAQAHLVLAGLRGLQVLPAKP
ncbi:MAG: YCF48-related protein [Burkholderiaceae bacterium]